MSKKAYSTYATYIIWRQNEKDRHILLGVDGIIIDDAGDWSDALSPQMVSKEVKQMSWITDYNDVFIGMSIAIGLIALSYLVYALATREKKPKQVKEDKQETLFSDYNYSDTDVEVTLKQLEKPIKAKTGRKASKKVKDDKPLGDSVPTQSRIEEDKKIEFKNTSMMARRFSRRWFRDKFMLKFRRSRLILVNMEMSNGDHRTFTVALGIDSEFTFNKKTYVCDGENKYYNADAQMYQYDFHEDLSLPIKKKFPIKDIKESIKASGNMDVVMAINPNSLGAFVKHRIAEGVMKAGNVDEFLRKIQFFIIITMVIVIIHFMLFIYASKLLENINMPFS